MQRSSNFVFSCADGSLMQEDHARSQTLRHQRVERFDAGGVPSTLRRGVTLCNAQGVTLCEKKAELLTFLKLIATLWKQGKVSGRCLVKFFVITTQHPENSCRYRKSHHSQFLEVVRQTKTNLDNSEESILEDLWNIDEHNILSDKLERIHAIPNPRQPTTQRLFVGR